MTKQGRDALRSPHKLKTPMDRHNSRFVGVFIFYYSLVKKLSYKLKTAKSTSLLKGLLLAVAVLVVPSGVLFGVFNSPKTAHALPTNYLNFQARLLQPSGALVADGTYNIEFKLYNASSSSGSSQGSCTGDSACLWTETRTSTKVTVVNGFFSVNLGDTATGGTAFGTSIDWSSQLWLTMNIGGTGGSPTWDGEMSPRIKLTGVPFAFVAASLMKNTGTYTTTLGITTPTANQTYNLPNLAAGTYNICTDGSVCSGYASSATAFIQNGNSFTGAATLGTNDGYTLAFETNNVTRITVDTSYKAYFGNGATNATPQGFTLQGTSGSGANITGAGLTIAGGQGTGTGISGNITFQYAPAGSSGSSLNALQTACTISGTNGSLSCPGAGSDSERFGAGATAAGSQAVAVGKGASAGGNISTAVGYLAVANTYGSTVLGYGANAPGTNSVALGVNATGNTDAAVAVGFGAIAGQNGSSVGYQALSGSAATALGTNTSANNFGSVAIGADAATTAANQLVVGGNSTAYLSNAYFGSGVTSANAASRDFVLHATGGSGTNIGGADLVFAGGQGTGTGVGGSLLFQTAAAGTSGSSLNALSNRLEIQASGNILVGTSDITGTLLVIDTKTGSGDPTGVNGGMYYNSNAGKFRCYENGTWADCITNPGGLFTDAGTYAYLTQNTDQLVLGATTAQSAKLAVVGTANEVQLLVKANATQGVTNPLVLFQNSSGTEISRINISGTRNQAFGASSLNALTTGTDNTGFGYNALLSVTNSIENTAFGSGALDVVATGANYNVGVGVDAGGGITSGTGNTAVGASALMQNTSWNTAVGRSALQYTTGSDNVAVGAVAGLGVNGTSTFGTAVLIGSEAGKALTTGSSNVLVGYQAGTAITTQGNNTLIGYQAGSNLTTGSGGNILIGSGVLGSSATAANELNIGNLIKSSNLSTGNLTVGTSDTTGQLFVLDTKTGSGDPAGVNGGMYYNSNAGKFRCYENGAWKDCDTTGGGSATLQTAYDNSSSPATITTSSSTKGVVLQAGTGFDNTALLSVKNAAGNAVLNVNSVDGTTTLRAGTDSRSITTLLDTNVTDFSTGWTTTGWDISTPARADHNSGNTSALSNTSATTTTGRDYVITFAMGWDCTSASDTVTVTFGGNTLGTFDGSTYCSRTISLRTTASNTNKLVFTPTTNYTNFIADVKIQELLTQAQNPALTVQNASGTTVLEVRASASPTNIFIGNNSGSANSVNGLNNVGIGENALHNNIDGANNTAIGGSALAANLTGIENVAVGTNALGNNTRGEYNTAVGSSALLQNTVGFNNSAFGSSALRSNTVGIYNNAFGAGSLYDNTTGSYNNAFGYNALYSNVSGTWNNAFGYGTLQSLTSGNGNQSFGDANLTNLTTGSFNSTLGGGAGAALASTSYSLFLGAYTGTGNLGGFQNDGDGFYNPGGQNYQTAIGAYAQVQCANCLVLGSSDNNTSKVGIGTTVPLNTFSVSPTQYKTGTISQTASTTVVGSGTTFTSAMVGGELIYADGTQDTVTGFTDATHITVTTSRTHASSNYRIHYVGLQVKNDGTVYTQGSSTTQLAVKDSSGASALTVNTSTLGISTAGTLGVTGTSTLGAVNASGAVTISGASSTLTFSGVTTDITTGTNENLNVAPNGTGNVTIGTSDTTGTLLVLDTKTGSGDPTCVDGGMYYNSNSSLFRACENGSWVTLVAGVDVQNFTANGTWTKPAGVSVVMVIACGGGGSGAGGRTGAAGSAVRVGGTGGGGGARVERVMSAAAAGATESVTVGAATTGGAASTNGAAGNVTNFGTLVYAQGGGAGFSGTTAATSGGSGGGLISAGAAGSAATVTGGDNTAANLVGQGWSGGGTGTGAVGKNAQQGGSGGGGSNAGTAAGFAGGNTMGGATGGGAGAPTSAANANFAGGAGGSSMAGNSAGGTAGATNGGNAGNGSNGTSSRCGTGGGGGGSNGAAGTGGTGGAGGTAGGGGGGGGAGVTGGAGGNGGRGEMWVISW